jgi:hypothetical protein
MSIEGTKEAQVTRTLMQAAILGCAIAGILLWLNGHSTAGVGLVIAGYFFYIAVRVTAHVRKSKKAAREEAPESEEPRPAPDSWEALRDMALEALNRKLRGQKLALGSFFSPISTDFAALEKVRRDLSDSAPELVLRTDMEVLGLRRGADETSALLSQISAGVESEDDLRREIECLRAKAQA